MFLVIDAGCAECRFDHDETILGISGPYDTVEAAKAELTGFDNSTWREHPNGGWFVGYGSGEVWIIPIDKLPLVK